MKIRFPVLLLILFIAGCSQKVYLHPNNVIAFNRNGIPVSLPSRPFVEEDPADGFRVMSDSMYDQHLQKIFKNFSTWSTERKKDDPKASTAIAVVIHGGLNTYTTSLMHLDGLFSSPFNKERANEENDGHGRGLDDSEFPLSIIWNAGAVDALGDRYKRVRNGEASTSTRWDAGPLFAGDALLISPAEVPKNYFATYLPSWFASYKTDKNTVDAFETAKNDNTYTCEYYGSIKDRENLQTMAARVLGDMWILPLSLFVEGTLMEPGRWTYYMMQRHVERMFQIDRHDAIRGKNVAEDFAERYYDNSKPLYPDLPVVGNGPLGVFLRQLRLYQKKHPDVSVNIYAHSMGSIVADSMIARSLGFTFDERKFEATVADIGADCDISGTCKVPSVNYGKIVFMSAADTIRNWQNAVWPYLLSNSKTIFYNFTLNPISEYREQNYFMPRGSLLTWIDDYLVPERDRLDRTVGRLENLLAFPHEVPWQIKNQVRIITFPATGRSCIDNDYRNCDEPQVHSDTFRLEFWHPEKYIDASRVEATSSKRGVDIETLKKSLPKSKIVAGFDIDDTVLFSSPGFYYAFSNSDGPGGKNKYGEKPLNDPAFWHDLNIKFDKFSIPKAIGKKLVEMHKDRGDTIVFITGRKCDTDDQSVLEKRLQETFGLNSAHTICTNEQSKTPALKDSKVDIYYGDSDSDIENARAVPGEVNKVRPIRVQRTSLSTNTQGYNPGKFSEEVLLNSEN